MLAGMKNKYIVVSLGAAAVALLASQAPAADGTRRCFEIYEDAARLACYDALFGKPARPAGATQTAAPAQATPSAPAVPAAPPVVSRAAAPAAAPVPPAQPTSRPNDAPVTGRIVSVSRLSGDRFAITLDNGQVWTQLERDPAAEVRVGDTVSIKPAMLGSWMLETRGGVRTRVRAAR